MYSNLQVNKYLHTVASCWISSTLNFCVLSVNLLTPNVNFSGRTAPLTSKVAFYIFIQQI